MAVSLARDVRSGKSAKFLANPPTGRGGFARADINFGRDERILAQTASGQRGLCADMLIEEVVLRGVVLHNGGEVLSLDAAEQAIRAGTYL